MLNIYKIVSPNTNRFYIGSTTQPVKNRFACHRSYFRSGCNKCSSYDVFVAGDATYEVIDRIPLKEADSKDIERRYIQNEDTNQLVNYHYVEDRKNRKGTPKYKRFKNPVKVETNRLRTKCLCGCDIDFYNRKQHLRSLKHSRNVKNIFAGII